MTLHRTIDGAKKFFLGLALSIGVIIIFTLIFQLGVIIKNVLFPPPVQPENHLYDRLPALEFPKNATPFVLTYKLNTISGTLPEFPSRLNVFPIKQPQPNFLNFKKAQDKAVSLGFKNDQGAPSPEKNLGKGTYEWARNDPYQKTFTMSIITFNFTLTSNYLSSPTVHQKNNLGDERNTVNTVENFLRHIGLPTSDIDFDKTIKADKTTPYITTPKLFMIEDDILTPTTSLSKTQVIRVDLYQKNMTYSLNTGIPEVTGGFKKVDIDLPILYPSPPYSTMNFIVASGEFEPEVVESNFVHQSVDTSVETEATYLIKTSQEAFDELTQGKGYVASYAGNKTTINITKVYLAYYLGETIQKYLMPIVVFEGDDGFFGYVSAVKNDWIQ